MDGILAGSAVGLVAGMAAAVLVAHMLLRAPALAQPKVAPHVSFAAQAVCCALTAGPLVIPSQG